MRDYDEEPFPGRVMGYPPHEAGNQQHVADRVAFETADRLQRNVIREWLALDPFGGPQRRYRRACSCGHNRYCGPGCGAHTE